MTTKMDSAWFDSWITWASNEPEEGKLMVTLTRVEKDFIKSAQLGFEEPSADDWSLVYNILEEELIKRGRF